MAAAKQAENEIADLVATLAGRQPAGGSARALSGPERAAVLMLALGDQQGDKVWKLLDDDELRTLSVTMSSLGTVEAEAVEALLLEFVGRLSASGALLGNYDATERLLQQYLPPDRVSNIMEEIRGPAGRNMWEKLSNVQEQVLANYLKNEYPQTVAVVLSKIRPEHAARVLAILPEGAQVKKGALVCELDASDLKDRLAALVTAGIVAPEQVDNLVADAIGRFLHGPRRPAPS